MERDHRRRYPLHLQMVLPADYRERQETGDILSTLADRGFEGVELNIEDPWRTNLPDVVSYLAEYRLRLLNFASGLTAKALGLSLSTADETLRADSVERCVSLVELLKGTGAGIIIGFLKGPADPDPPRARERFRISLEELAQPASESRVPLVVEATNRYESSVANSLEDTKAVIEGLPEEVMRILPDTFHMNIEEADMYGALKRHLPSYNSVHLSDNNRFYPGFGAMDFGRILSHLESIGFNGDLAIEGNVVHNLVDDLAASAKYLQPLLK